MQILNNAIKYDAGFKVYNYKIKGDDRGALISIENSIDIPFEIKRVYYIFGTSSGIVRGKHAHKELKQVLICTNGSCSVLVDDGKKKHHFLLDKPDIGLYVNGLVWREMYDFSPDCVLMVLASDIYCEDDYIRNYSDFFKLAKGGVL
ncbi:MAG: dTDP-6-deoxy-3,4-keto-hexulose isomerase [Candidatus Melainabacteria bacterium GWF2_37_15]|nr:MAG: dTDP-6-deoxy-3,4-keto-hexulose isomerase [Candidatus Melainabacteria bacterium GWF2_37_15]